MKRTERRCAVCGAWTTSTSKRPAYCSPECRRAGSREQLPELLRKLIEKSKQENEAPPK